MKTVFVLVTYVALAVCNQQDVEHYLTEFGFHPPSSAFSSSELEDSLRNFQITFNLLVTGKADNATLTLMDTPRCGRPDNEIEGNGFAFSSPKWWRKDLTYHFASYTNDMDRDDLLEETAEAFKLWSDVTPLTFRRVESGGDIVIAFGGGVHGDDRRQCPENFDGKGKVLAHAYYPQDGRLHFDDAENFSPTRWKFWATYYPLVAVHEIGHILGLSHDTSTKGSIMYPYYQAQIVFMTMRSQGTFAFEEIENNYWNSFNKCHWWKKGWKAQRPVCKK